MLAGVGHEIEEAIRFNRDDIGKPGYAFAYVNQWRGDAVEAVTQAVRQAVLSASSDEPGPNATSEVALPPP